MARSLTVSQLIDRGTKRANMENSDLLSATEWKQNLSQVFGELYEEVADSGMRYYETEATISSDGTATYALPSDHLSTIGIDYLSTGTTRIALSEGMVQERNRYSSATGSQANAWAMVGTNITLYPTPPSGQTYYHVYVPQSADLSAAADGDPVDVITASGEMFIVAGLSAMAKAKEETDNRDDLRTQAQALAKLKQWAMKRSLITPRRPMTDDDEQRPWSRRFDPGDYRY